MESQVPLKIGQVKKEVFLLTSNVHVFILKKAIDLLRTKTTGKRERRFYSFCFYCSTLTTLLTDINYFMITVHNLQCYNTLLTNTYYAHNTNLLNNYWKLSTIHLRWWFYSLLHPFWNHWWSLQSDWFSAVRFIHESLFCSKSHPFPSQWQRNTKTKQPIRFQGFFKVTNQIAGKCSAIYSRIAFFLL